MNKTDNTRHWLESIVLTDAYGAAIISGDESISYSELNARCLSTASYLQTHGIGKDDRVAIITGNTPLFAEAVLAIWFLGAVPVPLNTRNTTEDIYRQIEHAGCSAIIYEQAFREMISPGYAGIKLELPLAAEHNEQKVSIADFSAESNALIMFTSGTTGRLKAVIHSFKSLSSSFISLDRKYSFSSADVWLASLPFYHIGGFMIFVRSLLAGGRILFPTSLKSSDIITAIDICKPQYFSVVTTSFKEMLSAGLEPYDGLKAVFLGGGPLEPELSLSAAEKGWPVVHVYGSTETAAMITVLDTSQIQARPDSAGSVIGDNKIFIDETSGEILVKSNSLFTGYLNDAAETGNKLKKGLYHTGDLGRLDGEGYLYVEARRDDIIISGGENISVNEVRSALEILPGVREAAVFAVDDDKWGQRVAAAVVPEKDSDLSEDYLRDSLRGKLASYKIPKQFFFIAEIPRTALGKIITAELKKMLTRD